MSNHPPDRRRPGPACHSGNQAKFKNTHRHHIGVAAEILSGAVFGLLLALLVVSWIDASLGTDPGHVEIMAEVAHHE